MAAVVPDITGTVGVLATFDGSGSTGLSYYRWNWVNTPPVPGSLIQNTKEAFTDNQDVSTGQTYMSDNVGLWHFDQIPAPSYEEDFENTTVGTLPAGYTTSGDANWEVESGDSPFGIGKAAVSQDINDNEESIMEFTTIVPVDSIIQFYWSCSSEPNYDFLEFAIDGVVVQAISGTIDWEAVAHEVTAGTRTFRWRYYKDVSATAGNDHGKVSDITIGEGTTFDTSGNSNDGSPIGAPKRILGYLGSNAVKFNGEAGASPVNLEYYSLGAPAVLRPTTGVTVSAWLKHFNLAGDKMILSTGVAGYQLYLDTNRRIVFGCTTGSYVETAGTADANIPQDTWTHVVGTYDGANVKVYIDGVEIATQTAAQTGSIDYTGSVDTQIGNDSGVINNQMVGELDEVAIFNRALTAGEVGSVYFLQSGAGAGIGETFSFLPDVQGIYQIELDGGTSTANANADITTSGGGGGGGGTAQGGGLQGGSSQGL